jgi:hypothetical protein
MSDEVIAGFDQYSGGARVPPLFVNGEIRLSCNGIGGELPLPLWERVGVRGYGLSIDLNPSPGSHLSMRRSRSFASAFVFLTTAAKGGLCLSPKGRGEQNLRTEA